MREIKFRVIDIDRKEVVAYEFVKNNNWNYLLPGWTQPVIGLYEPKNNRVNGVVRNQFTGFHDKNGKEIYEGDLVRIDEHYEGDHYYEGNIYKIIFEQAEFFSTRKKDEYISLFDTVKNHGGEVIGNIYENPELAGRTE